MADRNFVGWLNWGGFRPMYDNGTVGPTWQEQARLDMLKRAFKPASNPIAEESER